MQNKIEKALLYILIIVGVISYGYAFFKLYLYFSFFNKTDSIIGLFSITIASLSFLFIAVIIKGRKYDH